MNEGLSEDSLLKKLSEDLEKSGFLSEMRAIKIFLDRGWESSGGVSYFDEDSFQSREIDIKSHRRLVINNHKTPGTVVFFDIVCEVKKSSSPWIVFEHKDGSEYQDDMSLGYTESLIEQLNLPKKIEVVHLIDTLSLHTFNSWLGYGIHESFKNPDQPSKWYSAFVSAVKASEHFIKSESDLCDEFSEEREDRFYKDESTRFTMVKPLIILDGLLYSVEIANDNNLIINPINSAVIKFEFSTKTTDEKYIT